MLCLELLLCAGDVNSIEVGPYSNIQDNATVHVAKHSIDGKAKPTTIGSHVTIGEQGGSQQACTRPAASSIDQGTNTAAAAAAARSSFFSSSRGVTVVHGHVMA
jgi:hypothetical protein